MQGRGLQVMWEEAKKDKPQYDVSVIHSGKAEADVLHRNLVYPPYDVRTVKFMIFV